MARKIRFALDMENGVEVRTLEELKENFSLEKVLMHIASGKFDTWLRDRYYDDVADKVEALDTSDSNFNKKICEIFGVSYDNTSEADYEKAEEHNRRLSLLKAVSDEQEYIDNVDRMAFEQDDIYDLLDDGETIIYLCGEIFTIPLSKCGITYIGVNNPMIKIESKECINWEEKQIIYKNVHFDEKYSNIELEYGLNSSASNDLSADELLEKGDEAFFTYGGDYGGWDNCCAFSTEPYNAKIDDINAKFIEAFDFYDKASKAGSFIAKRNMAYMLLYGLGVDRDQKQSAELFREAAESGDSFSQTYLGHFYHKKFFSPPRCYDYNTSVNINNTTFDINEEEAFKWYSKAAQQGYLSAMYNCAVMCYEGIGTYKDAERADDLFFRCDLTGLFYAYNDHGRRFVSGKRTKERYYYLLDKAKYGDINSMYMLGWYYQNCFGYDGLSFLERNIDIAFEYYMKAAEGGHPKAQYIVGSEYYWPANKEKGIQLLKKSAEQGCRDAIYFMQNSVYSYYDNKKQAELSIKDWLCVYNYEIGLRVNWKLSW